jgi:hypothetical protein
MTTKIEGRSRNKGRGIFPTVATLQMIPKKQMIPKIILMTLLNYS